MSCLNHKKKIEELQGCIQRLRERCQRAKGSTSRLRQSKKKKKQEKSWKDHYQGELLRNQELTKRLMELQRGRRVDCNLLFQDIWEDMKGSVKLKVGYMKKTGKVIQ